MLFVPRKRPIYLDTCTDKVGAWLWDACGKLATKEVTLTKENFGAFYGLQIESRRQTRWVILGSVFTGETSQSSFYVRIRVYFKVNVPDESQIRYEKMVIFLPKFNNNKNMHDVSKIKYKEETNAFFSYEDEFTYKKNNLMEVFVSTTGKRRYLFVNWTKDTS